MTDCKNHSFCPVSPIANTGGANARIGYLLVEMVLSYSLDDVCVCGAVAGVETFHQWPLLARKTSHSHHSCV
jgi:hypothetical protein